MMKSTVVIVVRFRGLLLISSTSTMSEVSLQITSHYTNPMDEFNREMLELFNVDTDNYHDSFVTMTKLPVINKGSGQIHIYLVDFKKSFVAECKNMDRFRIVTCDYVLKNIHNFKSESATAFKEVMSRRGDDPDKRRNICSGRWSNVRLRSSRDTGS